jgi:flagellar motor switch/type III secretory pathway protein FliN
MTGCGRHVDLMANKHVAYGEVLVLNEVLE